MSRRSTESVSRITEQWDAMTLMATQRTETIRTMMAAPPANEREAVSARRVAMALVACERCGLDVPQNDTIGVLPLDAAVAHTPRFFCCWDCLGRWGAAAAHLVLVSDIDKPDTYYAMIELLSHRDLTREELNGIASACRRQVKALGG